MIPDEDKQRAVRLSEVRELRDPPSELKEVCDKISPIISDIYLARGVVARGVGKDLETLRSECDSKIEEATRLVTREETRRKEYGSDTTDTLPDAGSDTASGSGLSSLDPKGKRKAELQIPQTVSSEARKPIPEVRSSSPSNKYEHLAMSRSDWGYGGLDTLHKDDRWRRGI